MTAEIIEGTAVEIVPEVRAVAVVQQPGQAIVATAADPEGMVKMAAHLASVLKDMVERQQLYTVIQGKKYPHVEAWQTIGRLDNVVAREARPPIRHEDGSYEAFAEIIRLSDGMVIGAASALCGSPDDEPWGGTPSKYGKPAKGPRPENARRSMAATRAISRAFRGQYAWIMALAGYEPTPAEEMPRDSETPVTAAPRSAPPAGAPVTPSGEQEPYLAEPGGQWTGTVEVGKPPTDATLRQSSSGSAFGFVVLEPNGERKPLRLQVIASGELADALQTAWDNPEQATVEGDLWKIPWSDKDGNAKPAYRQVRATRIVTPDWTLPAPNAPEGWTADHLSEATPEQNVPLFGEAPRGDDSDLDKLAW